MKRLLSAVLMMFSLGIAALGQNPSPQPNFSTQLLSASPSLYLNFNDAAASFLDQISGFNFSTTVTSPAVTTGAIPTPEGGNGNGGQVTVSTATTPAGTLANFSVKYATAPASGTLTLLLLTRGSGNSFTIIYSLPVSIASTTALQTFSTSVSVSAGTYIGFWSPSGTAYPGQGTGAYGQYYLAASSSMPSGTATYTAGNNTTTPGIEASVQPSAPGIVTPRQPGFDSSQVNNKSAAFPYNGYAAAPNDTLGAIDWSSPWSMLVHVDRLNWDRTGTLVLASKGDVSSSLNNWWKLYLTMSGNYSQLCFARNGNGTPATTSATGVIAQSLCTGALDAVPNGFNYDILVTNSGTGAMGSLSLYVNGLNGTYLPQAAGGYANTGFGAATVTASGGTGYAASTPFTSSGGGVNCVVAGTMNASSGVASTITFTSNNGCTSLPTITLTAPTGTGATINVGLTGVSMNSASFPLMVPGYVSAGAYNGIDSADSTQTSTYVDEFAIFPTVLNQTQIQSLFYQTKFWQEVVKPLPSTPYTLVFDDDSCGDFDNPTALELAIAAQKIGYIRLAGVVDTAGDGISEAIFRQMLDEAGLAHIPMSVPSSFGFSGAGGWCSAANATTYDASTPQVTSAYPQAKTMYRQIFANNPTTPVFIMLGGSFRGVADWMASAADSISPLTGAQMVAQNAANGGAIYAQGLGANLTFSGDNSLEDWTAGQYVVENNGAMPIYWYGGIPQSTGPGVLVTRTGKDPFLLAATAVGSDVRQGYDSLPTQSFLSSLFSGGVNVAISGSGTGYAASTPFTATGGGANCVVTGLMVSTGGVPSSIVSTSGVSGSMLSYAGLGSGCFSAAKPPTIVLTNPTGSGAVLTATTTASPCGTVTITSATSGSTSTATCSNHYFLPYALNANQTPVQGALMEWFINSLIDPAPGGAPRGR